MRTSDFGFRSMSFAAAIVTAAFVFSSCSKENIAPSTNDQTSEEVAARKAPVKIFRRKIIVTNPDIRPGVRDTRGVVLADHKINIDNNQDSRESAEDEIRTDGMGGIGRSMKDNSVIENHKFPSGNQFHPRTMTPRSDNDMKVVKKEIIVTES
jgi:hypothetical protein